MAERENGHTWQGLAETLRQQRFDKVIILSQLTPAQLITGFIFCQLGIIHPQADIIVRDDARLNDDLKTHGLPLFNSDYCNPELLRHLVDKVGVSSGLGQPIKNNLLRLAGHAEHYRRPGRPWWDTQHIPEGPNIFHRSFFNLLRYVLLSRGFQAEAYRLGQEVLSRLVTKPGMDFSNLLPIDLVMPVIKSRVGDPDRRETAKFQFDRSRALLLTDRAYQFTVVIGGSPNSGKSTFAASLYAEMRQLIENCERDGILPNRQLTVGLCDLDLSSPTSCFIAQGKKVGRGEKQFWDNQLVDRAVKSLKGKQQKHRVVIADLPGGVPDHITSRLSQEANFSILIDHQLLKQNSWREFLLGAHFPIHIMGIHTRFGEPDRLSAIRVYESRTLGDKLNFLRGRVVDLDRQLKLGDPVIQLAAHVLLFDYLPESVIWSIRYRTNLLPPTSKGL